MARFATFLLAVSCALSTTAAVHFPALVEVDLVFPRNETYVPTPVFPVVFAIQNLAAASSIGPLELTWAIWRLDTDDIQQVWGNQTVDQTNSTEPYYKYINLWTAGLDGAESARRYQLWWQVEYSACFGKKENPGSVSGSRQDNFTFTLDPNAQQVQPILSADLDACPASNATIMVKETWPVNNRPDHDICGVVRNVDVDAFANPCAVKLDHAAASSIAAEVTASACAASPPALTSGCPTETKDSAGSSVPVWSGLGLFTGLLMVGHLLLVL
jgi:hypothetical protein